MLRLVMTLLAMMLLLTSGRLLIGPRTFEDHAAQAVWTWRLSGAEEIWRKGFVPAEELSAVPPEASERIAQEEYGWVVAGSLPAAPAEAQIRWDDGSTLRVPVIGARQALQALSPWPEEYTFPDDEVYKLTGADLTTMRMKTVRGMATVPAWRLSFSNLPGPIDHAAIDQAAIGTVKGAVGDHMAGDQSIADYELLDERTLLVTYGYGACGRAEPQVRLRMRVEPDVVVLGLDVLGQGGGGVCAGVGRSGRGVIRLDEPLGDRVVLDVLSRLPVLCHRARNACSSGNG
ncbi:hypothetical protein [Nonomuraea sp. NPDC002799]